MTLASQMCILVHMSNFEELKKEIEAAGKGKVRLPKPKPEPTPESKAEPEAELEAPNLENIHNQIASLLDGQDFQLVVSILSDHLAMMLETLYDETQLCDGAKGMACISLIDTIDSFFRNAIAQIEDEDEDEDEDEEEE